TEQSLHPISPCCCFMTNQLLHYHVIDKEKSWDEAQKYCREEHTDLAAVRSMADMERLSQDLGNKKAWIGLYREAGSSRMWQWSQPEVQFNESQSNWDTGEPNDVETENCGTVRKTLKWVDLSCKDKKPFICYDGENVLTLWIFAEKHWTDAQDFCRDHHTDLISGAEQLKKLNVVETQLSLSNLFSDGLVFIGLFRDAWQWSDGSNSSFRFWNLNYDDEKNENDMKRCSRTWEEALYYCRHHHHDLVTITSLEEQTWVQEKASKALTPYVWTGLRYTCTLGFWFWVSGEVVRFKNWASPEQVNKCDMSGAMETGGEHKWFKKHDEKKFNFICSPS
uniref:C-type lectin domain-containing protein n=1 Tax=Oryzias melastigma TaxID=30732 RepID=A0A3B3CGJ6_ORYME